ncbi:MAG TPA: SDR family NAD(P)-dependent oxidoreductase [Pyrinomonadaceae bacterium]|jgi:NAD(P)-dependent dehydrogenase (short-subunit alcohol dehydrogenase family)
MDHQEKVKVALITGCSSGIGHATALALLDEGFHVVATGPKLDELVDLRDQGCEIVELDITDEEQRIEAIRTAECHHGAVDVLVNNTGYGQYGPIEEIPLEAIRWQFEVNLFGMIRMSQLVLPAMRRQNDGRIINLSSTIAGEIEQPGAGIYRATKHAIEAIDAALRVEVEDFGIHVIGIQPGPVNTNFDEVAAASIPDTGPDSPYVTFKQNIREYTHHLARQGGTGVLEPEDVAKTIVEAATDDGPETRYHVGTFARTASPLSKITPDSIWDAAMRYRPTHEHKHH